MNLVATSKQNPPKSGFVYFAPHITLLRTKSGKHRIGPVLGATAALSESIVGEFDAQ